MLQDMEKDLGLEGLTKAEKSILAAIKSIQSSMPAKEFVATSDIQAHSLCSDLTNPTFFRAIADLQKYGMIELPEGRSKGLFRLSGKVA